MAFGNGNSILGPVPGSILGGQAPRIPWRDNPMITMAGMSLLGGRTLQEGFQNVARNAPFGMNAKAQMQDQMLAQQEKAAAKAEADARRAQMNEVIKNWTGIPENMRSYYLANPDQFGSYVTASMKAPESTDDMREYDFAKSQGYTGTFQDYMTEMKRAGASTTNIDNIGSIPQGYEVFKTPEGATQMRPIPGGPADTSVQDDNKRENQVRKADIVLQDIDRTLEKVERIPTWTTGFAGDWLKGIAGTGANDTARLIDSVKANIGFEQLNQMRSESKTGAALGSVQVVELQFLQSVMGSLEQSQSPEQLTYNLKRLKNAYLDIVHGPGNGPPREPLEGVGDDGWTEVEPGVRIREKP